MNELTEILLFFKKNIEKIESENCEKSKLFAVNFILNSVIELGKTSEENKNKVYEFFKNFKKIFPIVISSIENSRCSCKREFGNFIYNNIQECSAFVLELIKNNIENLEKLKSIQKRCIDLL